jgi:hypothetical protein
LLGRGCHWGRLSPANTSSPATRVSRLLTLPHPAKPLRRGDTPVPGKHVPPGDKTVVAPNAPASGEAFKERGHSCPRQHGHYSDKSVAAPYALASGEALALGQAQEAAAGNHAEELIAAFGGEGEPWVEWDPCDLSQPGRCARWTGLPPQPVPSGQKKSPAPSLLKMPGKYLAATYSHRTCRPNTIGAAAFHFRVRNGTGWFHRALATRGRS